MLIFDLVNPTELNGFVRGIQQEQEANRFVLSQFLPSERIESTEFRANRANGQDEDAATFRTFDSESPIARRLGATRIRGALPPISRKIRVGEEERLRLEALRSGDQSQIIRTIYDDAAKMTRAVLARLELARGEALHAASLTILENGVGATVSFGRTGSHSVVAATLWSDLATSDPINDLLTWIAVYNATNGTNPGAIIVSTAIVNNLLRNAKVRVLAGSLAGTPGIINREQLNGVLNAFGLPPLFVYDVQVRVGGVATRVIPANKIVMVPPGGEPLGSTFYGITAEALELVGGGFLTQQQAPGLVSVVAKEFDPVATWTKAAALALPVLVNPDLTFAATVQ